MTGTPPVALTVAGSDSSGGAGVQADLKSFAALGVFGTTAITAVTAQNTTGISHIDVLPPTSVTAQIEAVLADLPVAAVKTGMLGDAHVVAAVAALAEAGRLPNLVVDPVMVASSGAALASEGMVAAYRRLLLPAAAVVTPNLPEAVALADPGAPPGCEPDVLARRLGERTGAAVVVKGGHGGRDRAVDVLWSAGRLHRFSRPRIPTANSHGSGCSFAAALAACLARHGEVVEAVEVAGDFVHRAIAGAAAWQLGAGPGPLDHFGWGR